jgi:hypothetical protein
MIGDLHFPDIARRASTVAVETRRASAHCFHSGREDERWLGEEGYAVAVRPHQNLGEALRTARGPCW